MKLSHFVLPAAIVLSACDAGPIAWENATSAPPLVMDDRALIRAPTFPKQCPGSVRTDVSPSGLFAVWWSLRADSSADVVVSRGTPTGWSAPVRIDTADIARIGCDRPAPAIAADGDNVHVVYSMRAKEGPGVFLSHSMDAGRLFHSPVAVVYGERPALASVAARGNFVVVAYEDPNTTPTRISVAVSNTMAHLFDFRETISPEDFAASEPTVLVTGKEVVVSWRGGNDSVRVAKRGTVR